MNILGPAALRPLVAAAVLIATSAATAVHAQGTEEERRACTPDVMRLCREFIPSVQAITRCLIVRRAELNPACRQVMTPPRANPVRQVSTAATRRGAARRGAMPHAPSRTLLRPPMNIVPANGRVSAATRTASRRPAVHARKTAKRAVRHGTAAAATAKTSAAP